MHSPTHERWIGQGNTEDVDGRAVHDVASAGSYSRSHPPPCVGPRQRPRNTTVSFDKPKAARRQNIIQQVWYRLISHCDFFLGVPRHYTVVHLFSLTYDDITH